MDSNETKIYIAILIGASVLGILLLYFIVTILRHQRLVVKFHEEKILAEITTLEKDRSRIVADLHDELGPLLSTVKLQLNSLESPLEEDHILIEKASNHLDKVLARIREISNNLTPHALTRKGLTTALQEFIDELNANSNMQILLFMDPHIEIGRNHEVHIYRIIQEIVNNAIKHAHASEMLIHMESLRSMLKITISDNGCGFSPTSITAENIGLGLKNIMSRVDIMRGDLYLDAAPGKGTLYTIEIPPS